METEEKPACAYGSKCYRKNPKHFETYSHPSEDPGSRQTTGDDSSKRPVKDVHVAKKIKLDTNDDVRKKSPKKVVQGRMKQTVLQFGRNDKPKEVASAGRKESKKTRTSPRKQNRPKPIATTGVKHYKPDSSKQAKVANSDSDSDAPKQARNDSKDTDDSEEETSKPSGSWTFVRKTVPGTESKSLKDELSGKSPQEIIKTLFLVNMPPCFYSFYEFCKSVESDEPQNALDICELKLVGPFDVLLGKTDSFTDKETALCHWRYYYDPPEFQTVLATHSGYHIGYWRDEPDDVPVFLASNNCDKDCIFKMEGENLFGTVFNYLENFMKTCNPFAKVKVGKFSTALKQWAEKHKFTLDKETSKMSGRQKRVVSKTFHKLGIVVEVDKKTELGYRPLIETEANLKKICKLIMNADSKGEREALWDNLQPLINAANIANDECDFGNSLELGIDLFCMGSPVFHDTVQHLLTTSYSLLGRTAFEEIIQAHLKRRKTGHKELSVI